jgi:N-acetylglucosaminyldiphosphoundecaprenol N-acetyl-beta-D-mannosaminyltransferase
MEVLGVKIYNKTINHAVSDIVESLLNKTAPANACISATGAHGIIEAYLKPPFKEVLNSFYWNLPDGMPTVWVGWLKGEKQMERCYGPDFFKALLTASANKNIQHFFCGGKEGVAAILKEKCLQKFANNHISGVYCPPFREMNDAEMLELGQQINASSADIVWIGISTPKQEIFAQRLSKFTRVSYIITVGAAFDFHTDLLRQAPKWMQKAGLEWFFRLLMEPRRLYKRFFTIVPLFIWLNIKEFVEIYIFKKNRI